MPRNIELNQPFTDLFLSLADGELAAHCAAEQYELARRVRDHQKKGELTIKIIYLPNGDRSVKVTAKVTTKSPHGDLDDTVYYFDDDGQLVKKDPNQGKLFKDARGNLDSAVS